MLPLRHCSSQTEVQELRSITMTDKSATTRTGNPNDLEARVRGLAGGLGYQLRRADHVDGAWHLVDPNIDGKIYSFSFTRPRTFTLEQIEELLLKRQQEPS